MTDLKYTGAPDPAPSDRVLNGKNLTRYEGGTNTWPTDRCVACMRPITLGEHYTLVRLGPGEDPIERQRAREGRAYNPVLAILHWACATGEED